MCALVKRKIQKSSAVFHGRQGREVRPREQLFLDASQFKLSTSSMPPNSIVIANNRNRTEGQVL